MARFTVERLMKAEGLVRGVRRKRVVTTVADREAERAPDQINGQFVASAPNRVWAAGFTHVATWSGTVYVAFFVDTFSRRIVGWSAATNKQTSLVLSALERGLWQRDRANVPVMARELIHHSDAGAQYTSFPPLRPPGRRTDRGRRRRGRPGQRPDGIDHRSVQDRADRTAGPEDLSDVEGHRRWVDWFNHRRLHGETGHVPPAEYETAYYQRHTNLQVEATI
ncbi:DDE-type integrase/transposase/recombinase [Streptomyces sp. NPDC086835]|uniref:DDE-type integrase/transposase/recombinase n=1 Tax=Streptomyces sp. NPDC086835 TaxID=3365761 RepID=UPI00380054E4